MDRPVLPVWGTVTAMLADGDALSETPNPSVPPCGTENADGLAWSVIPEPHEPPPPPEATSVAGNVTEVRPVPLAVNVVAPVPELFAVIVTFCAVAKFDGVNVSDVGDSVSPVFPLAAIDTVTFEDGAEDSDIPTVPVLPCVMFCDAGVTSMLGVPVVTAFSVTVITAEV